MCARRYDNFYREMFLKQNRLNVCSHLYKYTDTPPHNKFPKYLMEISEAMLIGKEKQKFIK